jgi:LytS/YehU family sensor histidine kinase
MTAVLIGSINTSLITYWAIVLVAHALRFREEGRARALRAAELSAQLSEARLDALKAQLHPHFLFNTMNAISAFVRSDPERSERMLAELAELLRLTLTHDGDQEVTLADELEFAERYLYLQRTRLRERLRVSLDVPDDLRAARVPSMILQPLLENAVEHGIAHSVGGGHLGLSARRVDGRLRMEVVDDGPGLPPGEPGKDFGRIGLANTRERLVQLYGDQHRFEVADRPEGGVRARIEIPWRTEPPP